MKTHVKFACLLMMLTREPFLFYTYMKVTLSSIRSLLQKGPVLSPCNVANGFDPRDIQVNNTSQSWSCWRISFSSLDLDISWHLWTLTVEDSFTYHYTQFCKCFLPELQSISCPRFFASSHWFSKHLRSTFLGSKEHSGVSMCEPHISCLRLPWDAKFYLDSCWILSKRDCQAATFHNGNSGESYLSLR